MIKSLSPEELMKNYELHLQIIDTYLSAERASKVKAMIEHIGEDYVTAPASSKAWYHGCYPGGYLEHVNGVVSVALKLLKLYEKLGGTINFTQEELVFSALFHDLGKIGNGEKPNYLPQENDWFKKNRQEYYINNPELDFMLVPDRSLYVLQKFGITVSQQEYLAIKLHDGLFDESNKAYYVSFNPDSKLKTNIVPILHSADYLASKLEWDKENREE